MWLSDRKERQYSAESCALTGPVTLPGDPAAAWLEGERRGVQIYAPGGYHWMPREGEELLVLKAGAEGEVPCGVGVVQEHPGKEEPMDPGDVYIESGPAHLCLRADQGVKLSHGECTVSITKSGVSLEGQGAALRLGAEGTVEITGQLKINGVAFQPVEVTGGV